YYDTDNPAESPAKVARKAIHEGAGLLLGPLTSATTRAVIPVAALEKVNVVSLSSDESLATPNVFMIGFAPEQQIKRVVEYASDQGVRYYYALLPADVYGRAVAEVFKDTVQKKNGTVRKTIFYPPRQLDVIARLMEIESDLSNIPEGERIGLLIPEGGDRLLRIASALALRGLENQRVQLLGSGQWDDVSLTREPALLGGWFASSPPEVRKAFEEKFEAKYRFKPLRITSLAYDAVALAVYLSSSGADYSSGAIANARGFSGINGAFRCDDNGECERGLAVLQLNPKGIEVINFSPQSFSTVAQ
ncbi:MAG: penicillin-binding protein activator, partial [Rectinemataceae bacterium]|nr:penicillin-binding protein activator [Rectinemataceae bacterium]